MGRIPSIEETFWTGGPEAYQANCDAECLVVFAETSGVMRQADIAKSAQKGRWRDVSMNLKGIVTPSDTVAIISYECQAKRKDGHDHRALVSKWLRKALGSLEARIPPAVRGSAGGRFEIIYYAPLRPQPRFAASRFTHAGRRVSQDRRRSVP
jgi:hypothetical protein